MSTFLELVQELHSEVGAAGSAPSSALNQRGEAARLVNWVRRADKLVQNLYANWKFLRAEYDQVTTSGSVDLPAAQNTAFWDEKTFKIFDASNVEYALEVVEYDAVKSEVRDTTEDIPYRVIIMNDNTLEVEPTPDAAYRVTADRYHTPTLLAADADISDIPAQFHDVILGRAMILYANHENAPEMKTQGQEIYLEELHRLQNSQLPNKFNSQYRTGAVIEVIASQ